MFEPLDAQGRCKTSRSKGHGLPQGQAGRKPDGPGRRDADVLTETSRGVHPQIVAGDENLLSLLELAAVATDNFSSRVDPGGVGKPSRHTLVSGGGKGILVVEGGIQNPDEKIALGQIVNGPCGYPS